MRTVPPGHHHRITGETFGCRCGEVFAERGLDAKIRAWKAHCALVVRLARQEALEAERGRQREITARSYRAWVNERLEWIRGADATTAECAQAWNISPGCARRWLWRQERKGRVRCGKPPYRWTLLAECP